MYTSCQVLFTTKKEFNPIKFTQKSVEFMPLSTDQPKFTVWRNFNEKQLTVFILWKQSI